MLVIKKGFHDARSLHTSLQPEKLLQVGQPEAKHRGHRCKPTTLMEDTREGEILKLVRLPV